MKIYIKRYIKRFIGLITVLVLLTGTAYADRLAIPSGSLPWSTLRDTYLNVMTAELYTYLGATEGVLPSTPTFGGMIISGSGNSWIQLYNNTEWTDTLTGLGGFGILDWHPYTILNGTPARLALYSELGVDSAPTIQAADPTLADPTGWYAAQTSGDIFYVNHGIEMFAVAGTRTADETAPVIVAGADSTHDGSTPVSTTMVLTELYPDPATLLYTVTGGTPASGTWTGTYPNYSVEITPTGTDPIVVTSAASDLAGNVATGTDLVQEFAYSGLSAICSSCGTYNGCTTSDILCEDWVTALGATWTDDTDAGVSGTISHTAAPNGVWTCSGVGTQVTDILFGNAAGDCFSYFDMGEAKGVVGNDYFVEFSFKFLDDGAMATFANIPILWLDSTVTPDFGGTNIRVYKNGDGNYELRLFQQSTSLIDANNTIVVGTDYKVGLRWRVVEGTANDMVELFVDGVSSGTYSAVDVEIPRYLFFGFGSVSSANYGVNYQIGPVKVDDDTMPEVCP